MKRTGLVSIITAAYRAQTSIWQTVASVCAQTYQNWELILVSDDGIDYAPLVPDDERIRFVSSGGVARGASAARNAGLAVARGEFVAPLDSDDLFFPDRLQTLVPLAASCGVVTDNMQTVDAKTGVVVCHLFERSGLQSLDEVMDMNRPFFPVCHRDLVSPWDEDVRCVEDVLFNLRIVSRAGGLSVHPLTLSEYRIFPDSLSHAEDAGDRIAWAYSNIIACMDAGRDFGLSREMIPFAHAMFVRKRRLNEVFLEGKRAGRWQHFTEFLNSPTS